MKCPKCFNEMYHCPDKLCYTCKNCNSNFKNISSTPTKEELYNAGIEIKNYEKLKIAVICDNKQDFISYIKSHNTEKYDYIYVSENSYPQGIEFDDMVDLRVVTLTIITRMKPEWLKNHNWFKGDTK